MLKLNDKTGYRKFINKRDEALEILLRNSRLRNSELTSETFRKILEAINIKYHHIMITSSRMALDQLEAQIGMLLEHLAFQIYMEMIDLRKKTFMLAYAGEAQAIGQVVGKTAKVHLPKSKIDADSMAKILSRGGGIAPMKFFSLKMGELRRTIISKLEYSFAFGEDVNQAMGRVYLSLPKQQILPKKKVLKTVKVTEASKPTFSSFEDSVEINLAGRKVFSGFEWDQETWNKMIEDLASEHVFTDRSPEKYVDIKNPFNDLPIRSKVDEEDKIYHWEIENETVHDFVEQVRSGQVEAAKNNGINDFVWIAILDDRTDYCCEWRNGLLTSEIEARLKTDKKDDDCQAIVPPAHFNCRCTLAPASKDLEAVDNTDNEREFDEWLNQR